jgi:uncharacterized protein YegP (UPF0339 family)
MTEIFSRRGLFGKRWYFRVRADSNGQIIAQSEGYSRRVDCIQTAYSLRNNVKEVIDV